MYLFLAWFLQGTLWASPQPHPFPTDWIRLLHYTQTPSGWESQVDGEAFFLAPEGKTDPQAEWNAFQQRAKEPEVVCRFPARARLLPGHSTAGCARLNQFRSDLQADTVSVVFSSYYIQHPASAFGHLLLKFHRKGRPPLLDVGVNYAANPDTTNPLLYAWRGLVGGFPGTFSVAPYFVKVAEYNDMESRDLWEYELDLNREQVQRMADHLWELGHTHFAYYYLSENCGTHLLSLLETVLPDRRLVDQLPTVVLPIDVVRILVDEDLVQNLHFRPSNANRFRRALEQLATDDRRQWLAWLAESKPVSELTTPVLDTALHFLDFRYAHELRGSPQGAEAIRKQSLLKERQNRPRALEETFPLPSAPHLAHRPHRVGLFSSQSQPVGMEFRFALHDPLDPPAGSPTRSRLEFFAGKLGVRRSGAIQMEEFALFHVGIDAPVTAYATPLSWDIAMRGERVPFPGGGLDGGVGLTWAWTNAIEWGTKLRGQFRLGRDDGKWVHPNLGAEAWLRGRWKRGTGEIRAIGFLRQPLQLQGELRYHLEGWSPWARWTTQNHFALGIHWYL